MDAAAVAEKLGWEVFERCAGGEFGAHLVERRGERAILKLHHERIGEANIRGSVELAMRVRERGQLVPRFLDVGSARNATYTLQEWVDGSLPERLTVGHARRMIELLETHAHAAADWEGSAGFTAWWDPLEVVRGAGGAVATLGDELADTLERTADDDLPAGDVVHDDYHFRNLLVAGDSIAAIIDWEGARVGDRSCDAFLLMWWCRAAPDLAEPAAADWLQQVVEAQLDDARLARYAAQMALRVLDFYQRTYPDTMDRWVTDIGRVLAPYWSQP